jgi:hypothetical protein
MAWLRSFGINLGLMTGHQFQFPNILSGYYSK